MKVTFLTAYFAPEITPVTHLFADLTADLVARGAEVTVIANKATRGLSEQARLACAKKTEQAMYGARVVRVGSSRAEGSGLAARALHFLANTAAIRRAARRTETDVYLINSMPPYLGLLGALLVRRAPTIYILQDIFPDSVLAMGKLRAGSLICRAFTAMERITYRKNSYFVTISEDMRQTLLQKGIPEEKLRVIPNWIDTDAMRPVSRADNPVFDRFGLDRSAFYVCYAGTLGILQDVDTLLTAAALIKKTQPEIRFLIFGGGALVEQTRARIRQESLDNVLLLPLLPVEEANLAYSAGDVSVITLKKGVTGIAMPSKTWSALAAARPLVCTADAGSAWESALIESGAAAIARPEDASSLMESIVSLYRKRDALPDMGECGRAYAARTLSRKDAADAYFSVLEQLCKRGDEHDV